MTEKTVEFNLTDVPDKRWITVHFDVLLDYGETKPQELDLLLAVKTADELYDARKKKLAELTEYFSKKKEIKPSEAADVQIALDLVLDWDRVVVNGSNGKPMALPFNRVNWDRVIMIDEARHAIVEAVAEYSRRDDLTEKNSKSLGEHLPRRPSKT